LITSNIVVGGVLCVPVWAHAWAPHPPFFALFCFCCFATQGLQRGCAAQGALRVWGLCGVVDIGDEFVLVLTITAAHVRFLCVAWTL